MATDEETKDTDETGDADERDSDAGETGTGAEAKASTSTPPAKATPADDGDRDSDDGDRDSDDGDRDSDDGDRDSDDGDRDSDDGDHAAAAPDHGGHDHGSHGHGSHGHVAYADEEIAHTTPVALLGGILAALLVLTVVTVAATYVDLGSAGNLTVAMIIATIKATLVVTFFMHLKWDKLFNTVVFTSSLLFVILFLSLAITDRSEYQPDMKRWDFDKAQQAK